MPLIQLYYQPSVPRPVLIELGPALRKEVAQRFSAVEGVSVIPPGYVRLVMHRVDDDMDTVLEDIYVVIFSEYNPHRAAVRKLLQDELRFWLCRMLKNEYTVHVWIAMVTGHVPVP